MAILVMAISALPVLAQKNLLKGAVVDTAEKRTLEFSIVALIDRRDSSLYRSVRSGKDGTFELTKITPSHYTLLIAYPKMADFLQDIHVTDTTSLDLGKVPMITEVKLLEEVVVRAGVPIRMRGDTLEYNADSFAVKPGSNVEELLKRLPGILIEKDGKIMAQGQEVKKVLVDGDEFFSDDPGLALKYLQAGAVEKVQVYDEKSEQAQFTGMDDGKRARTINLKLKKNRRNGYFGKLSAGSNGNRYYQHEAMGALFNQGLKISVFGLAFRNGAQGMNYEDMEKYVAKDYEPIDDGTGGMYYTARDVDEAENLYGAGLPETLTGGAHFSNKWGNGQHKAFGNYRIKKADADGWYNSTSKTVLPDGTSFSNSSETKEYNYLFQQKASGSITLGLDSFTTLKIGANGGLVNRSANRQSLSGSSNEKGFRVNSSQQNNQSEGDERQFETNVQLQKRFRKDGRTFTLKVQQNYSRRLNDLTVFSANDFYDPATGAFKNTDTVHQLQQTNAPVESYAVQGIYTDKFSKDWGYKVDYGWRTARSSNVFNIYNNLNGKFADRVDSLSNDYDFTVNTHITGVNLNWSRQKVSLNVGGKLFHTSLDQVNNDLKDHSRRRFVNIAPEVRLGIRLPGFSSLNFSYTGHTVQPSVEQLQPLLRTSNRLYVQEGNANLRPAFMQSANFTYFKFSAAKQTNFYINFGADYTSNAIVNQQMRDAQDRTVNKFINLDGIVGLRADMSYGWYYEKLHLRPSVMIGASRYGNYSALNGEKLRNESINANGNFRLVHEWKKVMTTTYSFTANFGFGRSSLGSSASSRNFFHRHSIDSRVYLPWKLSLNSDCELGFIPKNSAFNSSINTVRWNMGLEKKFLKDESLSLLFNVNDLLNQNTGYTRQVSGNYTNESNRFVIKRYFLLTATWNFTKKI
ncbi:outer membrane beta-barrel protein [Paraflavitalea sp. CAU 1676]|uniref:outer membrane beta-barrel protein n=1 Tax=Paraflavitalea sp. CAU 1676 TaxID=3032598 RepID=UPI0023DC5E1F|nr:outer membrane beta-barrel protein [Paraflavitalea sp. CAU 1676]MDF2191968.1 outer membrane beta-barrel protein [Paraflavitalea sp. CAU 1676]